MEKVFKRIISILIITVAMFSVISMPNAVYADDDVPTLQSMSDKIKKFKENGSEVEIETEVIEQNFSALGKILTTIGAGVLVIVITYMGIKYFISSPEEQAKLKGQLVGVAVSALVIFGAYSIWKITVSIFMNI